ncbi:MAG: dihydropteroate synthase [Balneolaceae bacterium]|nr:dihydropteroate synthase [Balneolaceae bacterium]
MGIMNATPDSFSDGGRYMEVSRAMDLIHIMRRDGVTMIDVGGESTRPGAEAVSVEEEIERVIPILESGITSFGGDVVFSIDTTKYEVAKQALETGAQMVNDVSGMQKELRLAELCAEHDAAYVIMHSQGDPQTMQENPEYDDVVEDVYAFLKEKAEAAQQKGVKNIILDPGIGFGKTLEHNLKLLAHLDKFKEIGFPLLVGTSRKSMLGKILNDRPVNDRLTATVVSHYHALMKGADIIRVHDVREASDSIKIFTAIQSQH